MSKYFLLCVVLLKLEKHYEMFDSELVGLTFDGFVRWWGVNGLIFTH